MSAVLRDALAFAAVAGLLTVIPGLDTAMVLRSTATYGRRHGFATALGVNAGALVWGAGAAVGVSALLTASIVAYTVVRLVGAAYMIWLGAHLLLQARRGEPEEQAQPTAPDTASLGRSWRRA